MSTTKKESEHSYYPGSKIVYDDPNKAQATGKSTFNKSTVDVSDSAVLAAREGTFSAVLQQISVYCIRLTPLNRCFTLGLIKIQR